jgi:hypothetical protein
VDLLNPTVNSPLHDEILKVVLPSRSKTRISITSATGNVSQCNKTRKRRVLTIAKEGTRLTIIYQENLKEGTENCYN